MAFTTYSSKTAYAAARPKKRVGAGQMMLWPMLPAAAAMAFSLALPMQFAAAMGNQSNTGKSGYLDEEASYHATLEEPESNKHSSLSAEWRDWGF